jgi:putative restriction endonuclease
VSVFLTESHGRWTVDALRRLPEDEFHRYEIDDGVLIVSPRPASPHQAALLRISIVLQEAAEAVGLEVLPKMDIVTHRRDDWLKVPDLVVVTQDAFDAEPQEYEARLPGDDRVGGARQAHPAVPRRDRSRPVAEGQGSLTVRQARRHLGWGLRDSRVGAHRLRM